MSVHGVPMSNVHSDVECAGRRCIVHRQTWHHMAGWPLSYRYDRRIWERTCAHGVGHPDPDQFDYWVKIGHEWEAVHGCDFCCKGNDLYQPDEDEAAG